MDVEQVESTVPGTTRGPYCRQSGDRVINILQVNRVKKTNMVHEDIFSPISFHEFRRIFDNKFGLIGKMTPVAFPLERTRVGRTAGVLEAREGGSDEKDES